MFSMLPYMCPPLTTCLLAVQKRTPCMCFSAEYFRRGLEKKKKCSQKQTAGDLLLIASYLFLPLSAAPPLLLSLSSQLFHSLSPLPYFTVYHTLPSSFLLSCFCVLPSFSDLLHSLPSIFHLIHLLPGSDHLSFTRAFHSPSSSRFPSLRCDVLCLPACLFHKGLSEASNSFAVHHISSHICRVRRTEREGEDERRSGGEKKIQFYLKEKELWSQILWWRVPQSLSYKYYT